MRIEEIRVYSKAVPAAVGSYRMASADVRHLDSTIVEVVSDARLSGWGGDLSDRSRLSPPSHVGGARGPIRETYRVESDWSDAELASIPCAYSTAENMLRCARVAKGEMVLITGASGGVGSVAVQLARRRGANVVVVASPSKSAPATFCRVTPIRSQPLARTGLTP